MNLLKSKICFWKTLYSVITVGVSGTINEKLENENLDNNEKVFADVFILQLGVAVLCVIQKFTYNNSGTTI